MAFDTELVDDSVETTDAPETPETETEDAQAEPEPDNQDAEQDEQPEQPDDGEADNAEPEPEKKSRASDRIKQLVEERNAAKAELEQLRQQSQQPQQKQTTGDDGAPAKPNIDDFDLDSQDGLDAYFAAQQEYDEKLSDYKLDQRLQQREQAKQQAQHQEQVMNDFKQAFEADPDFKNNFAELQTWMQDKPVTADPSQLYQGQDLMDVLAAVAADADLYYELADMTETQQYAKYGQIHAQTQARKQSKPSVKASKAPPPPNHTKANAPIKRDIYDSSDDEFLEARGL